MVILGWQPKEPVVDSPLVVRVKPDFVCACVQVITASGSTVSDPDKPATNGVIHVISRVMLPPDGNVVQFATANNFNNLTTLATAADLVTALSGKKLSL